MLVHLEHHGVLWCRKVHELVAPVGLGQLLPGRVALLLGLAQSLGDAADPFALVGGPAGGKARQLAIQLALPAGEGGHALLQVQPLAIGRQELDLGVVLLLPELDAHALDLARELQALLGEGQIGAHALEVGLDLRRLLLEHGPPCRALGLALLVEDQLAPPLRRLRPRLVVLVLQLCAQAGDLGLGTGKPVAQDSRVGGGESRVELGQHLPAADRIAGLDLDRANDGGLQGRHHELGLGGHELAGRADDLVDRRIGRPGEGNAQSDGHEQDGAAGPERCRLQLDGGDVALERDHVARRRTLARRDGPRAGDDDSAHAANLFCWNQS